MTNHFHKAAEIVANGWTQDKLKDGSKYCAIGALHQSLGVKWDRQVQFSSPQLSNEQQDQLFLMAKFAAEYLTRTIGVCCLPCWNDRYFRKQNEVVLMLQRIAAAFEKAHPECCWTEPVKEVEEEEDVDFKPYSEGYIPDPLDFEYAELVKLEAAKRFAMAYKPDRPQLYC